MARPEKEGVRGTTDLDDDGVNPADRVRRDKLQVGLGAGIFCRASLGLVLVGVRAEGGR